jgi:hypothetical protein
MEAIKLIDANEYDKAMSLLKKAEIECGHDILFLFNNSKIFNDSM